MAKDKISKLQKWNCEKLEVNQMTVLEGGRSTAQNVGCALSVIGLGLAFAGLVVSTGGVGLYIAAASYIVAPASAGISCFT